MESPTDESLSSLQPMQQTHEQSPEKTSHQPTQQPIQQQTTTQRHGTSRTTTRFVMNKVEKTWVLTQLVCFGAPLQKIKTLERTCGKVAENARMRFIPDSELISDQNNYGVSWRRDYMKQITADNVRNLVNTVKEMAKKVHVLSMGGADGVEGPTTAARGRENDAQHLLDQVVLDYKHEASKRSVTTDDDAQRALSKTQESRAQKEKRNRERKHAFEQNKRRREQQRETRERIKIAAEVQRLKAQAHIANAAHASAALQRRQSEQFGILLDLYAKSQHLPTQQPIRPLPPALPCEILTVDDTLLKSAEPTAVPSSKSSTTVANAPYAADFALAAQHAAQILCDVVRETTNSLL